MLIGPPKSEAGRRIVGIPAVIVPVLREHLAVFAEDEPGALVFPGARGGPLRRGNFNKMSAWPHAAESIGMTGLHFHDLRHTGNQFAAQSGARLRDLMARMGHDSERAALIYQHQAQGADKAITNAIDTHVQAEQVRTRRGFSDLRLCCGAGDGNRTRTISLGIKRGTSAECFPVLVLHVRSSHMSSGCAGIQPCPTGL